MRKRKTHGGNHQRASKTIVNRLIEVVTNKLPINISTELR